MYGRYTNARDNTVYAHTVECGHEETATLRNRGVRLAKNG